MEIIGNRRKKSVAENVVYLWPSNNSYIQHIYKFFYNLSFKMRTLHISWESRIIFLFFIFPFSLLFNEHSIFLLIIVSIFSIKIPLFSKIFSIPLWFPDFSLFFVPNKQEAYLNAKCVLRGPVLRRKSVNVCKQISLLMFVTNSTWVNWNFYAVVILKRKKKLVEKMLNWSKN